jgi:putative oxidoreductase
MEKYLRTDENNWALTLQRVVLGLVIFAHGAPKLLGWHGGYGLATSMAFLTNTLHLPAPIAFLGIMAESIGAAALVFGLFTRLSALGVSFVLLGAVFTTYARHGFFMNWDGHKGGEGYEYHVLALALAIPLIVLGGGRYALDTLIQARLKSRTG